MARGPNYRVPFKRRRTGKTNYHVRRKLLVSGQLRLIIRPSTNNIICQVADADMPGDVIMASAHSIELVKTFGWKYSTGNLPAAYLVGYLLGKKAIKKGIEGGIADIGLRIHINRTFAALKGMIDAGLDIPHSEDIFPEEDRLLGKHIEAYAKELASMGSDDGSGEDAIPHGIQIQFKKHIKNGADPSKISSVVADIKKKIDSTFK